MEKTAHDLALEAKKKNIIDMAFGFTAMTRVFAADSDDPIKERLASTFRELEGIDSEQKFRELHNRFCEWFAQTIKHAKGGDPASYGQGAKVLDIALKVYVYYCGLPDQARADYLIPLLNGAIDNPILRHLLSMLNAPDGKSLSPNQWSIKIVDKSAYDILQQLIRADIKNSFSGEIYPVQYDDIMWRRLNRPE
jgi:hypothetical protein